MADLAVRVHPEARVDLQRAYSWYFERNPAAAVAFLAEVDRAIGQISAGPDHWPSYLSGSRRFVLRRFPFSVVYRVSGETVQVLAFAHGRRRPGYWRKR